MLQNVKHKAYFDEINLMKGLAMFLAVVGHALPDATNGFNIVGGHRSLILYSTGFTLSTCPPSSSAQASYSFPGCLTRRWARR